MHIYFVLMFHNMTQKKRDCTVAVPLSEALELPLTLNKQHRSPRRYVRICTHLKQVCTTRIYISRGHQNAAMSWSYLEFSRFQIAKSIARFNAFIMSCNYPPERHNPKAWANYGCKGTTKFASVQIFKGKSERCRV